VDDWPVSAYGGSDQRDEVAEGHRLGSRRIENRVAAGAGSVDADSCEVVDVYWLHGVATVAGSSNRYGKV
jgi:hypothetical protein